MRVVLFCHSLLSDYGHGSAHFLRGVVSELVARGVDVRIYEPVDAWSVEHLVREHGAAALDLAAAMYPTIRPRRYTLDSLDLDGALDGADLVLVHEWNEADLIRWLGARRRAPGARFKLLFHDTHHRSVTDPKSMGHYDLADFDGVLAFGEAIKDVYARRGWGRRAFVWREAADVRVFRPMPPDAGRRGDVVWIGNWDDEHRTAELRRLFFEPVADLGLSAKIHSARCPKAAVAELTERGIEFGGWLPNFRAPYVYAQHTMAVHVPRTPYAGALRGVPTIGVFEALACGVPLIAALWEDTEGIFTAGEDFLAASDPESMRAHMRLFLDDEAARRTIARAGRQRVLARHTCAHRVNELLEIARLLETRGATRHAAEDCSA